jgi:ABC-type hemin transport system ATPase subunit/SAM-dependent methyltransferase
MRFSKINIPKNITSRVGLNEINWTKRPLGSTVALIGKNGAGKSRLLKLIEKNLEYLTMENFFENYVVEISEDLLPLGLQGVFEQAKTYYFARKAGEKVTIGNPSEQQLKHILDRINKIGPHYIKVVNSDTLTTIQNNLRNFTFDQLLDNEHFESILHPKSTSVTPALKQDKSPLNEFEILNSHEAVGYFNELCNTIIRDEFRLYRSNKQNLQKVSDELEQKKATILFRKFQNYVQIFLGKKLDYIDNTDTGINSILTFDGHPLNVQDFSPGQKALFAYAVLLFYLDINSKANVKESIIIIDEPEKHLHPEAQLVLIDKLKEIVAEKGQLWIATHSIHILSHLENDEIFMVENGEVTLPSSMTPGKTFNSLMGLEQHIQELSAFVNSTSEWAYANFMCQCFKSPEVISCADPNDQQYLLFKKYLQDTIPIKLLDFGAGSGRIASIINDDKAIKEKVKYYGYEINAAHHDSLKNLPGIQALYQQTSELGGDEFDLVLLCNVLHEIHPREWLQTFEEIKRVLKPNGYLLIVEDKFLPKGENAHEHGYLILGLSELTVLLNIDQEVVGLVSENESYRDRIVFAAVKKEQISPTRESLEKAIIALKNTSYTNLKELRKMPQDIKQGRMYANQSQLFINSEMALEDLMKAKQKGA